jgi:hypothetical protein
VVLPAVVARLRQVPDAEARGRLLTALLALLPQEEIVAMVEKLLEDERLLLDTPYLRRIREEGREEGLLVARRRSIVDVLTIRFAPPAAAVQQVTQYVETVTEAAALERLLDAAVRSASTTVAVMAQREVAYLLAADGIVKLTADTRFPGIFLDTHVPKYKELADR